MTRYVFFLCLFLTTSVFSDEGKFVLLLGPSGVGKSTIIRHLIDIDSRFVYVSPYTTRDLRPGEVDKIHVDIETMKRLEEEGKLLTINEIYGIYYATPKEVIDSSIAQNQIPILDWPVDKMAIMLEHYKDQLFTIYIEPESLVALKERLDRDGRDQNGSRFFSGQIELQNYHLGKYDEVIDLKVLNKDGYDKEVATFIYQSLDLKPAPQTSLLWEE